MGFRSVMITEDADPGFFPPWFVAKYERQFYMPGDDGGPMSSKFEIKEYDLPELYADIQRLLKPSENSLGNESFILALLEPQMLTPEEAVVCRRRGVELL